MARKKIGTGEHHGGESGSAHGDRPWVFFMVDCFFLITQFFVLTFKFKTEESILPQHLPPGGTVRPTTAVPTNPKEPLRIHVSSGSSRGTAVYDVMNTKVTLADLSSKLAAIVSTSGPDRYTVRISYDTNAQWGDVMAVINACTKVKISECGFVPLHGVDAPGGGRV
jgi:biopolymer transport protein ExbD